MNLFWFAADYRVQGRERSAVSQDGTDKDLEVALNIFQVGQAAAGDRRAADHINSAVRRRKRERAVTAETTEMSDDVLALRQALSCLPETDRLMLTLFYQDGFKGIEIAAALGIPLGTVKSRLFKARADLKSIYMTKEGEENGL